MLGICYPEGPHFTALSEATLAGHDEIVSLLLKSELKLSRSSCNFFHALIFAAWGANMRILQTMLSCADFDTIGHQLTQNVLSEALEASADKGHVNGMKLLLEAGAPFTHSTLERGDISALSYAATAGQNAVIELLLDNGADVNEQCYPGDTPISLAIDGGFPRTVALLLDRGAQAETVKMRALPRCATLSVIKVLLEYGVHERYPESAKIVLETALADKHEGKVALLHEYGVTLPGRNTV
ncbi:ankyrin repeat-containing domain protein [Aspergillus aurantiobrunneus]